MSYININMNRKKLCKIVNFVLVIFGFLTSFISTTVFALSFGKPISKNNPELLSTVMVATEIAPPRGELCTGVLISETTVVTASHCFVNYNNPASDPNKTSATVSLLNQKGQILESIPSVGVIVYPHANGEQLQLESKMQIATMAQNNAATYSDFQKISLVGFELGLHDVAIVRLAHSFKVPHQAVKIYDGPLKVGDTLHFAGYGELIYNEAPKKDTPAQIADFRILRIAKNGLVLKAHGKTKPMPGDSGGPMYIYKNNQPMVAAINVDAKLILSKVQWQNLYSLDSNLLDGYSISMLLGKFAAFLQPFTRN